MSSLRRPQINRINSNCQDKDVANEDALKYLQFAGKMKVTHSLRLLSNGSETSPSDCASLSLVCNRASELLYVGQAKPPSTAIRLVFASVFVKMKGVFELKEAAEFQ